MAAGAVGVLNSNFKSSGEGSGQAAVLSGADGLHTAAAMASCRWLCSAEASFRHLHSGVSQQVIKEVGPGSNSGTLEAGRSCYRCALLYLQGLLTGACMAVEAVQGIRPGMCS